MTDSTKGRAEPTAIVLAAGEGTRMASRIPKVLHRAAGRSLLGHAIASVTDAGASRIAVVVGPHREDVAAEAYRCAPGAEVFVQTERRGTAHAVLAARKAIEGSGSLLITALNARDYPLVTGVVRLTRSRSYRST